MTKLVNIGSIGCSFESLTDPRHTRNRKHVLGDVIVISVAAILCGCDGPTAIHRWAVQQAGWLSQCLALPNGTSRAIAFAASSLPSRPRPFNIVSKLGSLAPSSPHLSAAKTEAEREIITREITAAFLDNRKADREAIRAFLPLLRGSAAEPAAIPGLIRAAFEGDEVASEEAGSLLHRHHLSRPEVLAVAEGFPGIGAHAWIELILRDLLSTNLAPANHRPKLRFALATFLSARAQLPALIADNPARAAEFEVERAA